MATSISGRVIDGVIAAGVATWFREAGFTPPEGTVVLPTTWWPLFQSSTVQASKTNMPNDARFAVNVGVEWPYW